MRVFLVGLGLLALAIGAAVVGSPGWVVGVAGTVGAWLMFHPVREELFGKD